MYKVSLSERNKKVYDIVSNAFKEKNTVAINQATGTGKSYIAMELIANNSGKNILYLAPTLAILKQFKYNMLEEGLLGEYDKSKDISEEELDRRIEMYFPGLELRTYHWFHMNEKSLDNKYYHYMINDEYHHTGGDKWYLSFNEFKAKHKETKYFGMSATPQRLDGQATLFSYDNDVVYTYTLAEAILDGELPIPRYIDFGVRYLDAIIKQREVIREEFVDNNEKKELLDNIDRFIKNINSYGGLSDVFNKYLDKNSKVLYFCPPSTGIDKINDTKRIYEIFDLREEMFGELCRDAHYYMSFGEYKDSEKEEELFKNDKEELLRILYTVNKYNEGVHIVDINALIMGRGTMSVALFYQQIGRALAAGRKSGYSPIIIDLVGNIHLYQEIVDEVRKEAVRRVERGENLPKNLSVEEYMKNFEIIDLELGQKEFFDKLKHNIEDNRLKTKSEEVIKRVLQVKEYCLEYGEWPRRFENPQNEQEELSKFLYIWLNNANYRYREKAFKYSNIMVDGESVKDILDNLFGTYGRLNASSEEYIIDKVNQIKKYCEEYGEWPKRFKKTQTEQEELSKKLRAWLSFANYNRDGRDFKHAHIMVDGESIKDILDNLFEKYGKVTTTSEAYVKERVSEIEKYCLEYGEWPKRCSRPKNDKEKLSRRLYGWLRNVNYNQNGCEFRYSNIMIDKESVKDILDNLFEKYGRVSTVSEEYVIDKVNQIRKYCDKYEEWPKLFKKPQTEQEKLSNELKYWLDNANYNHREKAFKYSNIMVDGVSVKDILDRYYAIYTVKMLDKAEEEYQILNIWQAKDSDNIALSMYYFIVEIMKCIKSNNEVMLKYYKDCLENKIGGSNISVNVDEIIFVLSNKSIEEQVEYFYQKYTIYSIENNNDLALLFRNLYNYSATLNDVNLMR